MAELGGGHLLALEIKASAAPGAADARHLVWLRDRLEDRFARGAIFHTGAQVYDLEERIVAIPSLRCGLKPDPTRRVAD